MKHLCIKCNEGYEDEDEEAYYCPPCNEVRKEIAAELDKKRSSIPKKQPMSAMQEYDASPKLRGFLIVKN